MKILKIVIATIVIFSAFVYAIVRIPAANKEGSVK